MQKKPPFTIFLMFEMQYIYVCVLINVTDTVRYQVSSLGKGTVGLQWHLLAGQRTQLHYKNVSGLQLDQTKPQIWPRLRIARIGLSIRGLTRAILIPQTDGHTANVPMPDNTVHCIAVSMP